jgi:4-amino-4-deoxy-L-arabinose transferase-like glycosyltransferase
MRIAELNSLTIKNLQTRAAGISRETFLRWCALVMVMGLAAGLRFVNLNALGFANHYYASAVVSMSQSWHNFFFAAAEPGGSVSVDKPPLGLWLQVISAAIFGVNSLGLLLPQLLAGLLSVLLIYHLVRRSFGTAAGLLAGLALAVMPVVVATDRNNTMDSTLVFSLLLAAWAFIKATETSRLRYLLLGAFLVGVGFNIKMLEAFIPLPAFYLLYLTGASEKVWRKLLKLAAASVLLVVVSLSWMTIVDLTPANQRPYVGSSGNNSELNLALGYNGMNRLLGMGANSGFQLGNLFGGNNN